MPYRLRKAPKRDLYWVVGQDGTKHSKEPLPKERADAQMKALYIAMRKKREVTGGMCLKRKRQPAAPVTSVPNPLITWPVPVRPVGPAPKRERVESDPKEEEIDIELGLAGRGKRKLKHPKKFMYSDSDSGSGSDSDSDFDMEKAERDAPYTLAEMKRSSVEPLPKRRHRGTEQPLSADAMAMVQAMNPSHAMMSPPLLAEFTVKVPDSPGATNRRPIHLREPPAPAGRRHQFETTYGVSPTGSGKRRRGDVSIPKNEFIKEHEHLVNLLEHGTVAQRKREAKSQAKELAMKRGGVKLVRPPIESVHTNPLALAAWQPPPSRAPLTQQERSRIARDNASSGNPFDVNYRAHRDWADAQAPERTQKKNGFLGFLNSILGCMSGPALGVVSTIINPAQSQFSLPLKASGKPRRKRGGSNDPSNQAAELDALANDPTAERNDSELDMLKHIGFTDADLLDDDDIKMGPEFESLPNSDKFGPVNDAFLNRMIGMSMKYINNKANKLTSAEKREQYQNIGQAKAFMKQRTALEAKLLRERAREAASLKEAFGAKLKSKFVAPVYRTTAEMGLGRGYGHMKGNGICSSRPERVVAPTPITSSRTVSGEIFIRRPSDPKPHVIDEEEMVTTIPTPAPLPSPRMIPVKKKPFLPVGRVRRDKKGGRLLGCGKEEDAARLIAMFEEMKQKLAEAQEPESAPETPDEDEDAPLQPRYSVHRPTSPGYGIIEAMMKPNESRELKKDTMKASDKAKADAKAYAEELRSAGLEESAAQNLPLRLMALDMKDLILRGIFMPQKGNEVTQEDIDRKIRLLRREVFEVGNPKEGLYEYRLEDLIPELRSQASLDKRTLKDLILDTAEALERVRRTEEPDYISSAKYKGFSGRGKKWIQNVISHMKKGAFTKQALHHGETPLQYAKKVLSSPTKHTVRTRRRAQFLKNIHGGSHENWVITLNNFLKDYKKTSGDYLTDSDFYIFSSLSDKVSDLDVDVMSRWIDNWKKKADDRSGTYKVDDMMSRLKDYWNSPRAGPFLTPPKVAPFKTMAELSEDIPDNLHIWLEKQRRERAEKGMKSLSPTKNVIKTVPIEYDWLENTIKEMDEATARAKDMRDPELNKEARMLDAAKKELEKAAKEQEIRNYQAVVQARVNAAKRNIAESNKFGRFRAKGYF